MKQFFLKVSRTKSGEINLNGAYLSSWEGDTETILIPSIRKSTPKGWESKKPIFEDLDIVEQEGINDLIISEDCANILVAKYADVKVKIYALHNSGFTAAHAIANFITKNGTDPYDRG